MKYTTIYADCACGGLIKFPSGKKTGGNCNKCGTRHIMSAQGNSLYIEAVDQPRRARKGRRGKSSKKTAKKRSSSKTMKSAKRLFVNFVAVMLFVSCMVVILAAWGG